MEQNDKMKQLCMAMNARIFLLFVGIMLVMNSITSTGRNGLTYLQFAGVMEKMGEDADETEESAGEERESEPALFITQESLPEESELQTEPDLETVAATLKKAGVTAGDMRLVGILGLIAAVFEAVVGVISIIFANRIDKYKITLGAVIVLLIVESICLVVLFLKGALLLSSLLTSLVMPLVLLWSALRYRKLHRLDPERVYAVQQGGRSGQESRQPAPVAPPKTLRERAMIVTEPQEEDAPSQTRERDEIDLDE